MSSTYEPERSRGLPDNLSQVSSTLTDIVREPVSLETRKSLQTLSLVVRPNGKQSTGEFLSVACVQTGILPAHTVCLLADQTSVCGHCELTVCRHVSADNCLSV